VKKGFVTPDGLTTGAVSREFSPISSLCSPSYSLRSNSKKKLNKKHKSLQKFIKNKS